MADYLAILDPKWLEGRKVGQAFPDLRIDAVAGPSLEGATLFVVAFGQRTGSALHQAVWLVGRLEHVRPQHGAWVGDQPNPLTARPAPALDFLRSRAAAAPGISPLTDLESARLRLFLSAQDLRPGTPDDDRLRALAGICQPATLRALRAREARWRHDCRATHDDRLRALLRLHDYPAHGCVLDYERHFGGLEFPACDRLAADGDVLRLGPNWAIGAGLLERGTEQVPDLVPVSWGPGDAVYYLDADGQGFVEDLIEGGPQPLASRGAPALVDAMVAWLVELYGQ